MRSDLEAHIWRRGRGVMVWRFIYIEYAKAPWFTSPGWYHFTNRKFVYRMTIDHDFPGKPLWLGRKIGGRWQNMEGLYEPLMVVHKDFAISNRKFPGRGKMRSLYRVRSSRNYIERKTGKIIYDARSEG